MSASTTTIATLGWTERNRTVLKSLVSVFQKSADREWIWSDSQDPDVLVIDVDHEAGRSAWSARAAASRLAVAYTDRATRFDARFRLDKPLRGRGLVDVLRAISRALDAETGNGAAIENTAGTPDLRSGTTSSIFDLITSTRGDAAIMFSLPANVRFIRCRPWRAERGPVVPGRRPLTRPVPSISTRWKAYSVPIQ